MNEMIGQKEREIAPRRGAGHGLILYDRSNRVVSFAAQAVSGKTTTAAAMALRAAIRAGRSSC